MRRDMKPGNSNALEEVLGHVFLRPELLEQALTHSSHAHEREPARGLDNEQLEFLGDAVLSLVVSEELMERFPQHHEGHLSRMRAHLVSASHLAEVAGRMGLGRYLRLGRGEEKSGGRSKSALLVNTLEAVLGALYLDDGLETARTFVRTHILETELRRMARRAAQGEALADPKSVLQEFLQGQKLPQPSYATVKEEGPEHKKIFTVEVRIQFPGGNGERAYRAKGPTKKIGEQEAARKALKKLKAAAATAPRAR